MTVTTTWVSPVAATLDKTTGAVVDETMTDAIASDLYNLGGAAGYIGCHVYHSVAFSLTSAVEAVQPFNSERVDASPDGAMHDNVTLNSRITIRTAGMYHSSATVAFDSNATGMRYVRIRMNGTTIIGMASVPAATGVETVLSCTAPAFLFAATDYLEVLACQNSGGALNVAADASWSPNFSVVKA